MKTKHKPLFLGTMFDFNTRIYFILYNVYGTNTSPITEYLLIMFGGRLKRSIWISLVLPTCTSSNHIGKSMAIKSMIMYLLPYSTCNYQDDVSIKTRQNFPTLHGTVLFPILQDSGLLQGRGALNKISFGTVNVT